jgi:hypothetical protein
MIDKAERKAELERQLADIEAKIAERKAALERHAEMVLGHWQKRAEQVKARLAELETLDG